MEWLKDHVYIATWLGLPIAIIIAVVKNRHAKFSEIDWSQMFIYLCFLTCLGVVFTPKFDEFARNAARVFLAMSFGAILISAKRR